jgi:hypothetical protein
MIMASIRLYSQRGPSRGYAIADYDLETRALHIIEKWEFGERVPVPTAVDTFTVEHEPWESAEITVIEEGAIAGTLVLGPVWKQALADGSVPPGYGPTPSEDEVATTELLTGLGFTGDEL